MSEVRSCCNILPLAAVALSLALAIQFLLGGPPQAAAGDLVGATPFIISVSSPVLVGSRFAVHGGNFSAGALVNFFVSTAQGSANQWLLTPAIATSTALMVDVPANFTQGQGVVAIQVVNADGGYLQSNVIVELLQGAASAGVPSLTAINAAGLAASQRRSEFRSYQRRDRGADGRAGAAAGRRIRHRQRSSGRRLFAPVRAAKWDRL